MGVWALCSVTKWYMEEGGLKSAKKVSRNIWMDPYLKWDYRLVHCEEQREIWNRTMLSQFMNDVTSIEGGGSKFLRDIRSPNIHIYVTYERSLKSLLKCNFLRSAMENIWSFFSILPTMIGMRLQWKSQRIFGTDEPISLHTHARSY